jgi:hypothetical protein
MNRLLIPIIKYLSYLFKQNKKLIIFTDELTPRFYKICNALDNIGFKYEVFLIENKTTSQKLSFKYTKFNTLLYKFSHFFKLLKYRGSSAHFIINSELKFFNDLIDLKIFKIYVDFYDHRFLYKDTESMIIQKQIEHEILNKSNRIISRSLGLTYQNKNKNYKKKKILFLDYCSSENLQKKIIKKEYYNLLIIFPRWNSIFLYKNLEYIFRVILKQNIKIYLILNKDNHKRLNEIIKKNNFKNIYAYDFLEYESYLKNLDDIDTYLWISINELINIDSKDYVYKLEMHNYASSNRIYEMIERNIFCVTPKITRFDSYIINRYTHSFIYNSISDLKNLRLELEKNIQQKPKDISKIHIKNNIQRLIKFYSL